MANTVKIRNSSTAAAAPSSLEAGELAINTADGTLFWEDSAGSIQTTYLLPSFDDLSSTAHASTHATGGSDAIAPADIGAAPAASPTFTGVVTVAAGSASAPTLISDTGGSDTGIWWPTGGDRVAISTAGIERLRVNHIGWVGVGTNSPSSLLEVNGVITVSAGSAAAPALVSGTGTSDSGIFWPAADTFSISTAGVERLRIDSSGRVGIGTTSPAGQLELERASNADYAGTFSFEGAALQISDNSNSTSYPNASAQLQFKVGSSGVAEAWIAGVRNSANVSSLAFGTQSGATRTERVRIKSTGSVRFVPLAADPSTGNEAGDVYYNSTSNKLRVYNGTSWVDLH
jgi:hypothetical protein